MIRRFRWPLAALVLFTVLWPHAAGATVAAIIAALGAVCVWVALHPSALAFLLGVAAAVTLPRTARRRARITRRHR